MKEQNLIRTLFFLMGIGCIIEIGISGLIVAIPIMFLVEKQIKIHELGGFYK